MPIFITGACGFVGLALVEHLLTRGATVIGYDRNAPPDAARLAYASLPGHFVFVHGDVRNAQALLEAMQHHQPRALVTLAAVTAASARERAAPTSIADVNVGGVWNALAAAAACNVTRVVHASSGSVYGASGSEQAILDENDTPLHPEGLYGITKQAAEAGALRLAALYGFDLSIGRIGTCFGPWENVSDARDTPSAPLQVLRLARQGRTVVLPRAGLRDWLYVRDAAAALDALLQGHRMPHAIYNLAAGFQWSIAQWCTQVAALQPGLNWRMAYSTALGDVHPPCTANVDYYAPYDRAPMAIDRLLADTDYRPRYDLAAAARDLMTWQQQARANVPGEKSPDHA